jgi:L-glyceraldehyde 3-phosphate reductase
MNDTIGYKAAADRYEALPARRCGRSGVVLPSVTLGLWQNFGAANDCEAAKRIILRAFDRGVFHFDLANNYGPPPGHAESLFGDVLASDLASHRNELVISTKAGYDMWSGPFGTGGSRKYVLDSLDDSLRRMGLDHVDIFYSHRYDPTTPLDETMSALASAIERGKATYAGISSYSPSKTVEAAALLREMGVPLLIHQPSYSMFNRWIEGGLLDTLAHEGVGCIAFSALAQGLLTTKYLNGVPSGSRAATSDSFDADWLDQDVLARCRALAEIAADRDQTLAQMAIAWVLRDERVTSALIGASSVEQLDQNLDAVAGAAFTADELAVIDQHAIDCDIDLWKTSRSTTPTG